MDRQAVLAADAGPQLGASRAHVLDLLRAAAGPLGVREVAGQAGLHPNTARFHLDGLAGAGLAVRAPQPRAAPGRPSMMYRAVPETGPAGERRYRLLAEMLATMITGLLPDTAPAATAAGREWGRYLADPPAPGQRTDAATAVAQLTTILEQAGFDPDEPGSGQHETDPAGTGPTGPGQPGTGQTRAGEPGPGETEPGPARPEGRIGLRRCPFQEVARQHPDVVCALHLGLMQGALEELRAPVTASRLEPFAQPGLCIAHLGPAADSPHPARPARPARPSHPAREQS
jgi:predicted ArsR family transcriptional regulator